MPTMGVLRWLPPVGAVELGVPVGEDPTVTGHQPVTLAVGGRPSYHDGLVPVGFPVDPFRSGRPRRRRSTVTGHRPVALPSGWRSRLTSSASAMAGNGSRSGPRIRVAVGHGRRPRVGSPAAPDGERPMSPSSMPAGAGRGPTRSRMRTRYQVAMALPFRHPRPANVEGPLVGGGERRMALRHGWCGVDGVRPGLAVRDGRVDVEDDGVLRVSMVRRRPCRQSGSAWRWKLAYPSPSPAASSGGGSRRLAVESRSPVAGLIASIVQVMVSVVRISRRHGGRHPWSRVARPGGGEVTGESGDGSRGRGAGCSDPPEPEPGKFDEERVPGGTFTVTGPGWRVSRPSIL